MAPASEQPDREVIGVPEVLSSLLVDGGLTRGTVVSVAGARSVVTALVARVTADGGHVAVVGASQLSLLAAAEMGADLSRIATIDDPGADRVEIAAVLLDGLDLVVLGLGGLSVVPSRARVVMARARAKGSVLMVLDGTWPGVQTHITAEVTDYRHAPVRRSGYGRIAGFSLRVRARGRGRGRPGDELRVDVIQRDGVVGLVGRDVGETVGEQRVRPDLRVAN
ncbi:hypothetical protein [Williamsia sterculiae]|uniref:hypothetical protein n=1 Tax=Williamsia sterculiae TaxID=1344003 RepID=UPI001181675F|nr:hypothetical protein [Williamsia sterculiae]